MAMSIHDKLEPHCQRLKITGELRRGHESDHIEMVAISKIDDNNELELVKFLAGLQNEGKIKAPPITGSILAGDRVKFMVESRTHGWVQVTVHLTSVNSMGTCMVRTTGPETFWRWIRTLIPVDCEAIHDYIQYNGGDSFYSILEEDELFRLCGLPSIGRLHRDLYREGMTREEYLREIVNSGI